MFGKIIKDVRVPKDYRRGGRRFETALATVFIMGISKRHFRDFVKLFVMGKGCH